MNGQRQHEARAATHRGEREALGQAADGDDQNEVDAVLRVFEGDAIFLFEDLVFEIPEEASAASTTFERSILLSLTDLFYSSIPLFGISRGKFVKRKK